ncbi:MAG: hypothetical protein E6R08_02870 [Nevskiaceae bacterium]|nr:MAG: hypothetical protein E6R08_02870 [Nevskiaceae bacterium]
MMELRNRTIRNFSFKVLAKKTAVNTAVTNSEVDLEQVTIVGTLHRGGVQHVLFSGALNVLAMESSWDKALWDIVAPGSTTHIKLVPAAAGVSEVIMLPTEVDLVHPINLSGDDVFVLQVNVTNRLYDAALDTSGSVIEFDAVEAVGLEYMLPYINQRAIQGGEGRVQLSIGDNVQRVVYLNMDKTNVNEASAPIAQFGVVTDRWSQNDNYHELLAGRVKDFVNITEANKRLQCFEMLSGPEFDKTTMDLTLIPANVTAGNNWIVTRQFTVNPKQVKLADAKALIHQVKRAEKAGLATSEHRAAAAGALKVKTVLTKDKR